MNGRSGRPGTASIRSTDGGREVLFEVTLAIDDDEGAGTLVTWTRVLLALLVASTVGSFVLVVGASVLVFASVIGGIGPALSFLESLLADRPLVVAGILLAVLVTGGSFLVGILAIVGRLGQRLEQQVHVRVTDAGVGVQRDGSHFWRLGQPAGVDVPFDAITAVEYLDPGASSTRVELRDARAPKFLAGRSRDWIRIERDGGPAVYVGSDRPRELAETIARHSPDVQAAEPY